VTTLELFQHSPDIAAAEFCVFYQLKSVLKRRHFCDATDIIKNAMEELKRLSQNGLYFKHLYSCWKRIVAQGHYFEGNVA
jgi:hypothetical protein